MLKLWLLIFRNRFSIPKIRKEITEILVMARFASIVKDLEDVLPNYENKLKHVIVEESIM